MCQKTFAGTVNFWQLLSGKKLDQQFLCSPCRLAFQKIEGPICSGCGRPLLTKKLVKSVQPVRHLSLLSRNSCSKTIRRQRFSLCSDCCLWQKKIPHLLEHRALYHYNSLLKEYMSRYKFIGDYRLGLIFKKEMSTFIHQRVKNEKIALVIPIPISIKRYLQRGFNQVSPWLPREARSILQVIKTDKVDQSGLTRAKRLEAKQPFGLKPDQIALVKGARVLLVDDVYTTGRTLYHAADCLYQGGAQWVTSVSLGR